MTEAPGYGEQLEAVLIVIRELARELGNERAVRAVAPQASLEREVGLGSLERVELLLRLEQRFECHLDESCLALDTAAALTDALAGASPARPLAHSAVAAPAALDHLLPADWPSITAALFHHGGAEPARTHVLLRDDEGREQALSYGRLLTEAHSTALALVAGGVRRGDTVALMLPTGFDFLRSFQAILIAGGIPVPIYPPVRLDRLAEYADRQAAILRDAETCVLIVDRRTQPIADLIRPMVPSLRSVTAVDDLDAPASDAHFEMPDAAQGALIQYTSGSTGRPKGVLLTHANLLANIRAIGGALALGPQDVAVSWLPLYHDMGLIGAWLTSLVYGVPLVLMSPLTFLARPERWLLALHERRGTISAAPNFAYELCVRKVAEATLEGLDLSAWRCALNGAEAVLPDTLQRFSERFARAGFKAEALMPVYGLAESSVALAFPALGRLPRIDAIDRALFGSEGRAEPSSSAACLRFVGVGQALQGHELRIVDEAGSALPERRVGRIVFRGPSSMAGYYRQDGATAAIGAKGGLLDSGDLGYLADGELFVTGRSKDLIIKGGRNLVPHEIEEAAGAVGSVRAGCIAAFGVVDERLGTERLIVVAETRLRGDVEREKLGQAVTERVAAVVGVPPDEVVLVRPGSVPKTSSGKVRRTEARRLFMSGALSGPKGLPLALRVRLLRAAAARALGQAAQGALKLLYALYLGAGVLGLALVFWPPVVLIPSRAVAFALARLGSRLFLRLLGCRLSVAGLENLPRQAAVIASNHSSYLDTAVLLAALPRDVLFIAKHEVRSWWLIGSYVRRVRHITVDRLDALDGVRAAEATAQALRAGDSVVVFPEGTFTAATGLRPFKLGAFKVAGETGCPIVPVALRGVRRVLRGGQRLPRPGPIEVWIGQPLAPQGDDWRALVDLRDRTFAVIAERCGEPRLDLVAAGWRPA